MHWGCYRPGGRCDLAGAADCSEFITVRPCSWATNSPTSSSSRLFASLGANCARKPSETCSMRRWPWSCRIKRVFRRSGPGAMQYSVCRCQEALREADFLQTYRRHLGPPDYVRAAPQQARNETCWALPRIAGGLGSRIGRKMTVALKPFSPNSGWNLTYR